MKEEFSSWFGKQTPISVNSCIVNGVRFVVHSRDEHRTRQNSSICSPGLDEEMYYGQLEQILEFLYLSFKTMLFRVKWFDTSNKGNVDAPPDIIDVDEDDDIINEEDHIPHDLANSDDDEDLVNLDIDDDVVWCYDGDGGGDDRKGTQKPNLGGRRAGRKHTHQETRNLELKAITDKNGPVPIRFKFGDRETMLPLCDHAAHWANYLKELTQFDLRTHMEFDRWLKIYAGIQQHLQKIYNEKKAALKERYWVPDEDGTYDVEHVRRGRPSHISKVG
uniref:S-adenosyl-L-methionine-dependent methyltransferases superfamily protein n=1 Tax=Tanacetum cinerariifolium TaxID=118510 RepID=A0A699IE09_TANCI|nr:S-adenosyl-L-methionine-dependent methyltransferases superfamily protein [Tanacetum cinerariifolium]